eukprot:3819720-Rhodomonas_salina.2
MSGTDRAYVLRAGLIPACTFAGKSRTPGLLPYAIRGTDLAYGCDLAFVLTWRMALSAYAPAVRCAVPA